MPRMNLPREFYIPKGAVKIAAKNSSAIAYIYQAGQRPGALLFIGKQAKPVWHYTFKNALAREKKIAEAFANNAAVANYKAEQAAKRNSEGRVAEVGAIFSRSWGYEQTNVNYYEVVKLIGSKSVIVREIAKKVVETLSMQGKCVPLPGSFIGEEMRCLAKGEHISVKGDSARLLKPELVAGIPVYPVAFISWYG